MKIIINKNTSYEDFKNQIKTKPKNEIVNSIECYIRKFEEKYNMVSNDFYYKYNEGQIEDHNEDFDDWYCKILVFSKYSDIKPSNINFINRG